jgi:hypothetical protein
MGKNPSNVPNTISDKKMADLRRRAQKSAPPMFSDEAIKRRLAANEQQRKAQSS